MLLAFVEAPCEHTWRWCDLDLPTISRALRCGKTSGIFPGRHIFPVALPTIHRQLAPQTGLRNSLMCHPNGSIALISGRQLGGFFPDRGLPGADRAGRSLAHMRHKLVSCALIPASGRSWVPDPAGPAGAQWAALRSHGGCSRLPALRAPPPQGCEMEQWSSQVQQPPKYIVRVQQHARRSVGYARAFAFPEHITAPSCR